MFGLTKPRRRPSSEVAGTVEAIGSGVRSFKIGDAVFGVCKGAGAEYACGIESNLVLKPEGVTFEEAASAPVSAFTALQGLRDKGGIKAGQRVLVNGASGGVGSFAVPIAKWHGAHVTGVGSTKNLDLIRSIGADRVIDYAREDCTTGTERYDLIFDTVDNHSISSWRRVMTDTGTCVFAGAPKSISLTGLLGLFVAPLLSSRAGGQQFVRFVAKVNRQDLATIADLMQSGKVRPVIDRRYPLSEIAGSIGYVEQGHARGKVVVMP